MAVSNTPVAEQIQAEREQALKLQIMRLKQLVRDMYGCIMWQTEPHGYMLDGCDHCMYKPRNDGCGLRAFAGRARTLGVDVDASSKH